MPRRPNPFAIKEAGGDIRDRDVGGYSERLIEGTTLGEPGLATLRRVISQRVPLILASCVLLAIATLGGRLIYLQGVRGQYLRAVAEGNRIRLEVVPALRGEIVDRSGEKLAWSTPSFNLVVLPADLPHDEVERQDLLNNLLAEVPSELLDQESLSSLSELSYLPRVVASGLPRELALKLSLRTANQRGLSVTAVGGRTYRTSQALGHLLGYVGKLSPEEYTLLKGNYQLTDSLGKTGLEASYENELRGEPGRRQVEVDALGHERQLFAAEAPIPGATLELTIDVRLQEQAYRLLASSAGRYGGSVVALDPRNGELLALASYPGFDPNLFTQQHNSASVTALLQDDAQPLFNRAISGQYPPGSTIKPFIALAALAEKIITPQTTIISTGGVRAGDQFFADWKAGGHGPTDVYRAIAESVNTFFYLIGGGSDERAGLGISRIVSFLQRFGFGRTTGLDLGGEAQGFIPTPRWKTERFNDRWYRGDTYNVSIGQGNLTVTPLQLATAYAAVSQGGSTPTPHLVRTVNYVDGRSQNIAVKPWGEFKLEPEIIQVVRNALRQTVTYGSARSLNDLKLAVAGKTGTAQTGPTKQPHAWFAGYAPAADPQIVVLVMIEYGGEGSATAVPIARQLFAWYLEHSQNFASAGP